MAWIQSSARYVLMNGKAQNSCLDISGAFGSSRQISSNQEWTVRKLENGNLEIKSVSYMIVDVNDQNPSPDSSQDDDRPIIGFPYHQGPNQQWEFRRLNNGNFIIKSVGTGLYLNMDKRAPELWNGVKVVASPNQFQWHVQDTSHEQKVRLFVPKTEFNVDLDFGNPTPGTTVALFPKGEPGHCQTWRLQKV